MEISIFWVIIVVSIISLLIISCFVYFGLILNRKRKFFNGFFKEIIYPLIVNRRIDSNMFSNALEEYLSRRNEFWTLYGQFIISVFVVLCITILLLTKTISAEAGLPILSGVGGFAIGKGITMGRRITYRKSERQE